VFEKDSKWSSSISVLAQDFNNSPPLLLNPFPYQIPQIASANPEVPLVKFDLPPSDVFDSPLALNQG
jgi:hypothetical protein